MQFVITSPKTGLLNQNNSHYLTEVRWDISDLPFVQNKDSSIEIILMGKRELIALLNLSSWMSHDG